MTDAKYLAALQENLSLEKEKLALHEKVARQAQEIVDLKTKLLQVEQRVADLHKIAHTLAKGPNGTDSPENIVESKKKMERKSAPKVAEKVLTERAIQNDEDEYGELVCWLVVIRKSHPGSLSSLKKYHRDIIRDATREFLRMKIGDETAARCEVMYQNKTIEPHIPENLIDDFYDWFNDKLDEGLLENEKEKRKSAGGNIKMSPVSHRRKEPLINTSPTVHTLNLIQKQYPDLSFDIKEYSSLMDKYIKKCKNSITADDIIGSELTPNLLTQFLIEFEKYFEQDFRDSNVRFQYYKPQKRQMEKDDEPQPKKPKTSLEPDSTGHIRYTIVLQDMYPDYNRKFSVEKRVDMKRKVKHWLKQKLGDQFSKCMMQITSKGNDNHQTYGISVDLMEEFKKWAIEQFKVMVE
ncbi:hypothetical protein HDV01_001243 [Terramyces sp. JEL0728]|nr:hypothetical protein HDV01_001243 [Terramyces sp. JEL0728]